MPPEGNKGAPASAGQDAPAAGLRARAQAFCVHLLTASGAAVGLLALERAIERDFGAVLGWLALALFIDAIDGTLARATDVKRLSPRFDGDILDLVIDFLNYVVVPFVAVRQAGILPPRFGDGLLIVLAAASAMYFADRHMKTADNWFRGFPALWNVVLLYILAFPIPPWPLAISLSLLGIGMFAPVRFVHPMRVQTLRAVTISAGGLWFVCAALVVEDDFRGPMFARIGLIVIALYFCGLSFYRSRISDPSDAHSSLRP